MLKPRGGEVIGYLKLTDLGARIWPEVNVQRGPSLMSEQRVFCIQR